MDVPFLKAFTLPEEVTFTTFLLEEENFRIFVFNIPFFFLLMYTFVYILSVFPFFTKTLFLNGFIFVIFSALYSLVFQFENTFAFAI